MKPFELKVDPQTNMCNIIDNFESERTDAVCIYNDLGCHPFSAAPALCDKLNDLTEEVMILRRKEMSLDEILRYNDEYFLDGEWGNFTLHHIRLGSDNHIITPTMVVDRLNKLSKLNKKVIEDNIGLQKENHELEKQLHELIDYVNELIEENQALKQSDNITDLETEIMQLKEERKVFFEIVDSFIRGVESEKGIAPENEKFQYAMDQTLNWMTRLREDLKNPNQYLKLRKQLEKENKMFLVDKEKENNMF